MHPSEGREEEEEEELNNDDRDSGLFLFFHSFSFLVRFFRHRHCLSQRTNAVVVLHQLLKGLTHACSIELKGLKKKKMAEDGRMAVAAEMMMMMKLKKQGRDCE